MSEIKSDVSRTKADLIIEKLNGFEKKITALGADMGVMRNAVSAQAKKAAESEGKLKMEMQFVSAQLESVCLTLMKQLKTISDEVAALKGADNGVDMDELASRVAAKIALPAKEQGVSAEAGELDYDALGYAVAKSIYVPQAVAEEIDYETLAEKIAAKLPAGMSAAETEKSIAETDYEQLGYAVAKNIYVPQAVAEEIDYETLAEKIAAKLPAGMSVAAPAADAFTIDYDELASKVASAAVCEPVAPDYIAAKVAEQIVIPASPVMDADELAGKVAEKLGAVRIGNFEQTEQVAETADGSGEAETELLKAGTESIDADEIADRVAKRVGSVTPEEFEITVDDDGCDSLAKALESKLDYEALASAVAEKVMAKLEGAAPAVDAEELANSISEKLSVNANVNEEALAEKAAVILSNYMPELDGADIADKVIAGVVPAIPAACVVDGDGIAETVINSVSEKIAENSVDSAVIAEAVAQKLAENIPDGGVIADTVVNKIAESQEESDYDIVIDDNGVSRISESITQELKKYYEEEASRREAEAEVKAAEEETEPAEDYSARFDKLESDVEEIKSMLSERAVFVPAGNGETAVTEEALVTVSDVVGEDEQTEEDGEYDNLVGDVSEAEAAVEAENFAEEQAAGGVDFANMMKYDRSFIARIIQGTDEQKNYYGEVKTALLSYKKVNSNIAWGAERFNKGRETIAKFKIRGKTLCLYLALDPKEYAYSVYHHADVSDNKSMHGTPMMVKIKSPRGVKKAIRLIDDMLAKRNGVKRSVAERDYAAMYPYETIEELIEDGLVKDVSKN